MPLKKALSHFPKLLMINFELLTLLDGLPFQENILYTEMTKIF